MIEIEVDAPSSVLLSFDESLFHTAKLAPLGDGHIHDTYLVTPAKQAERYVLQRINEYVFKDASLVMCQTERLLENWRQQSDYFVPRLMRDRNGNTTVRATSGLWRLWHYIEGGKTIDPLHNLQQIESVGRAFGRLQQVVESIETPFEDTIGGFLNLRHYLDEFSKVRSRAPNKLLAIVDKNFALAETLVERHCHIHGDCKVNNVLFDSAGANVIAVIDFDTAMYGHWAWDFGDLVRSVCFSAGGYDIDRFAACFSGFAAAQKRSNPEDAALAPAHISLMLAVRFLTDHLRGDVYFKTSEQGQNLVRAEEQFALFSQFDRAREEMISVAERILEKQRLARPKSD